MLTASKWLLIIAGVVLMIEAVMIFIGITKLFGVTLPCPGVFLLLGAGLLLFGISSKAFDRQ